MHAPRSGRWVAVAAATIASSSCAQVVGVDDWQPDARGTAATGGAAGSAGSAGSGGGASSACPQQTREMLNDDFDDAVTNDTLWTPFMATGTSFVEADGVLTITLAMGETTPAYAGYSTADGFDLRGCALQIEAVAMPSDATNGLAYLKLANRTVPSEYVEIFKQQTNLYFGYWLADASVELRQIIYAPLDARFWRMRVEAGIIHGEYSPDGQTWSEIGFITAQSFLSDAVCQIGAGTPDAETNPGSAQFDNLVTID